MKQPLQFNDTTKRNDGARRPFPVTDYSYQAVDLTGYDACCADASGNSFRAAREYFENEATRDFLTEAAVFVVMMVTIAAPLFNGLLSIVDLLRQSI